MRFFFLFPFVLVLSSVAAPVDLPPVVEGMSIDFVSGWKTVEIFGSETTTSEDKRETLEILQSPEEMPSSEKPFGGPVRSGLMQWQLVRCGLEGEVHANDVDTLERCFAYLISELSGRYSAVAADALSKIVGMCQPIGILNDPGYSEEQWEKLAARSCNLYRAEIDSE